MPESVIQPARRLDRHPDRHLGRRLDRRKVFLLFTLPLLATGCALTKRDLDPPEVTLRAVTPESFLATGQVFRCRFLLENPNAEDLDIRGGQVTLKLADFSAARGETTESFVLPAYGSKEVDLRVELDVLGSLPSLLRWFARGDPTLDYQLQGYVDLDMKYMGRLPFRSKGRVNADQLFRQLPGILRQQPESPAAIPAPTGRAGSTDAPSQT